MKQKKVKTDICLMLFFVILSLALLLWVIPTQIKVTAMMETESFTPRSFPYLIVGGLLLVSVIGLINNIVIYRKLINQEGRAEPSKNVINRFDALLPYLIFALIIIYGLAFRFLGIIPATILIPPIILWCLRCRKWQMYIAFYSFAAVIYLLFTRVLLVPIR